LRASYLASGAVERAIQWIEWGPTVHNPDGSPKYQYNQPRMLMQFPSGDAVVELIPEAAKLNVNTASPDDLFRVVAVVTGDPLRSREIVDGIIDWRTPSGGPTGFDQYYFGVAPTFRARHASLEEIEELLLVRGMTPEVFYGNYIPGDPSQPNARLLATGGLRDCLSVWGSNGPFDANTASPALMEAMGMPAQGAAAIVERRAAQPFRNMGEVGALGFPTPRLGIGGIRVWTLRASARLRRPDHSPSEVVRTAAAVVKMVDPQFYPMTPVHVLRWYQDAWSQTAIAPPMNSPNLPSPGAYFP
jgi:general secretion pathway protein K